MDELVITSSALLDLLRQIDELQDYDIEVSDTGNKIQVIIDANIYELPYNQATDVMVDTKAISRIEDINMSAYDEMVDSGEVHLDTIQSGILKSIGKTLLIGGLVRLTNKLLK